MARKKMAAPKIDPERKEALGSLPPAIRESLTDEEVEEFLTANTWSEELCDKLSEFLSPME